MKITPEWMAHTLWKPAVVAFRYLLRPG